MTDNTEEMFVVKRNGSSEPISFDKILNRIKKIGLEVNIKINYTTLVVKVIDQLYDGISTTKIDEFLGEQCIALSSVHPDYGVLASRIAISNHHKNTQSSFSSVIEKLYANTNKDGEPSPIVSNELYAIVSNNTSEFDELCDYSRDYLIDYFGFKTLEKSYLLKVNRQVVERPQHMWLRVSIGIHGNNMEKIKETYYYMSNKYFIHATPTLFNSGTRTTQLSSCFLLGMEDDSVMGIFNTIKDTALISKTAGGIGIHISNIRAAGSHIYGTGGQSNGIVPMLRVLNNTARYIDQGGGKRAGSFAVYLEPWHSDIEDFLNCRKNHGDENMKARDLFYGLWVCDLFMERVKTDGNWTLMCPNECRGLYNTYGDAFNELYIRYENENKGKKTIKARDLWFQILDSQMETGTPYLLYKDACNKKSNQQNIGTIRSSNLCTEIIQYSDANETAVCNLASIALPSFITYDDDNNDATKTPRFDFKKLEEITKIITYNLNCIIDINYYPTEKSCRSNMRNRPIGIGVQGLADLFILMNLSFISDEAKALNKQIFETIYYAALTKSCELAREQGAYETFAGSPASNGKLQFDLWEMDPTEERYPWNQLKLDIQQYGLRNSLLLAPMPTASTSQILGFNECFEPITSNIYTRRTGAGEFVLANKYLMKDLLQMELWNEKVKNSIIANNGSIQHIDIIPAEIREKYRTVWEIPMRNLIDMSADRGVFICQSQSLNLWIEDPNYSNLTSMHFYAWSKGLKTGIYYLRRRAKHHAQQFTIEPDKNDAGQNQLYEEVEDEICEMCSA